MGIKPPRAKVATVSIAMTIYLVTSNSFLALLPASIVLSLAKHQPLKAIKLSEQTRPIVVATLKNRTPNPVAKLFIEHAPSVACATQQTSNADV
jgi:DNA-binding transcriptional LysR family regulator